MLNKLCAEAKVAAVELRPASEEIRQLLRYDLLLRPYFAPLACRGFDLHKTLQRAVEVNVGRKRDVQQTLRLSEVQVGLESLTTGR